VHEAPAEQVAEGIGVVGRMISVISDCELATVRAVGLAGEALILRILPCLIGWDSG